MGKRWIIDYALGHTWNYYSARFRGAGRDLGLRYSLFVHWLATDRLLIGAGVNNDGADLSALIQATPNLQISLRGRYSMGYAMYNGYLHEIHALAGINWTI